MTDTALGGLPLRLLYKLRALARVFPRARRNRSDLARHLLRRPQLIAAIATYETALVAMSSVDTRLKALATIKTSSRIGCPF